MTTDPAAPSLNELATAYKNTPNDDTWSPLQPHIMKLARKYIRSEDEMQEILLMASTQWTAAWDAEKATYSTFIVMCIKCHMGHIRYARHSKTRTMPIDYAYHVISTRHNKHTPLPEMQTEEIWELCKPYAEPIDLFHMEHIDADKLVEKKQQLIKKLTRKYPVLLKMIEDKLRAAYDYWSLENEDL